MIKPLTIVPGLAFLFLLVMPSLALSQNNKIKDIEIVLECVEYVGNDKFIANFGYDNPNATEITVPESNSVLIFNNGKSTDFATNAFKSGRQAYVFQKEFSAKDRVLWHLVLPNGKVKEVTASANSAHCSSKGNIFPYYPPPLSGRLDNSLISPELYSLYQTYISTGSVASDDIYQISNNSVLIEIVAVENQFNELLFLLENDYGLTPTFSDEDNLIIMGWIPIENLLSLNDLGQFISCVCPVYPAILENTGLAINYGDYAMRSDFARNGFNVDGTGIKVGVLSDSYDTQGNASIDVINGDLPGPNNNHTPVHVLKDYPIAFGSLSDEGRAMLQIVYDIAPGAELAFRTGFMGAGDMAAGIEELADAGCNILVNDITYINEPFFTDGIIAQTVDLVSNLGVSYFSAAGNHGNKSYQSNFTEAKSNASIDIPRPEIMGGPRCIH